MGRIRENISVKNDNIWTLFDSGARNTYIIKKIADKLKTFSYTREFLEFVDFL